MLLLLLLFFIPFVFTAPINRAVAYTVYTATTSDDVIGCQTSASNVTNIVVNLFTIPSTGNFVLCVTDETGQAPSNFINIVPAGTDVINPGNTQLFQIATSFTTACFYTVFNPSGSEWIQRIF
jgi:hypothetical protein